jgi:uncharacterized membrane protein
VVLGFFAVIGGIVFVGGRHASRPTVERADVCALRVALDGRARKLVQAELRRIANGLDTSTSVGRMAMLREVTLLLRRQRELWVYGGAVNQPMARIDLAKTAFDSLVDEARSRFTYETVSNVGGVVTTAAAPDYQPRAHEGEGLILVSIVLATRTELVTVKKIEDGEELRKALEAAPYRSADDLIAIEVIWQPSVETDRLSSLELEQKYPPPGLVRLRGALVGRTFCGHCSGPFPAELVSCPHCGAPAREAA